MQHPGSWYIPWGMPLQKMLAMPFNPAAAGFHQPQIAAAAIQSPPPQQQPQQQNYQHQLHQTAAAMHPSALHQQPMHPGAMFTPLTLRNFMSHPHLNLGQQMATAQQPQPTLPTQTQQQLTTLNLNNLNNLNNVGVVPVRPKAPAPVPQNTLIMPMRKVSSVL